MENLGQYLKSLRTELQLTPEDVQREIKITIQQIALIENNQLTKLGDIGIARAIIYTYARYLNADEKQAMHLFNLLFPGQQQRKFVPKRPLKVKKILISTNLLWLVVIIIIVIILGGILWISYQRGYLSRPFKTSQEVIDTVKISSEDKVSEEKKDTLRAHFLEIVKENQDKKKVRKNQKKTILKKGKSTPDSIDYTRELIFDNRESPFNQ